jgi:histidinol phosphatase-like PHP family hydrolase
LHVHTPFSDVQIPFETLIKVLIKLNVKIVGLSDHVNPVSIYLHPKTFGSFAGVQNWYSAKKMGYRKEYIAWLNRKYHNIAFLHGGEIDIIPPGILTLPKGITPDFFRGPGSYLMVVSHMMGSSKYIDSSYRHHPKLERWMWKYNPDLLLRTRLWETASYHAFNRYHPDIFAHPQENIPRYFSEARIRRFMWYLKKYDIAYELNHFFKYVKIPEILKWGAHYGVKFSIGSDFHGFKRDDEAEFQEGLTMFDLAQEWNLELLDPRKFLSPVDLQKLNLH